LIGIHAAEKDPGYPKKKERTRFFEIKVDGISWVFLSKRIKLWAAWGPVNPVIRGLLHF